MKAGSECRYTQASCMQIHAFFPVQFKSWAPLQQPAFCHGFDSFLCPTQARFHVFRLAHLHVLEAFRKRGLATKKPTSPCALCTPFVNYVANLVHGPDTVNQDRHSFCEKADFRPSLPFSGPQWHSRYFFLWWILQRVVPNGSLLPNGAGNLSHCLFRSVF